MLYLDEGGNHPGKLCLDNQETMSTHYQEKLHIIHTNTFSRDHHTHESKYATGKFAKISMSERDDISGGKQNLAYPTLKEHQHVSPSVRNRPHSCIPKEQ